MTDILHNVLDVAGVDRKNRADGVASRVYSVAERLQCLINERDRLRRDHECLRESHMAVVARAGRLTDEIATLKANGTL